MAYNPSLLTKLAGKPGDVQLWTYSSADPLATAFAANYFADASVRGMQRGDVVTVIVTSSSVPVARGQATVVSVGSSGATLSVGVQELTATGAVLPGTAVLELNHGTIAIAATLTVVPSTTLIVKDTSATGTAAHTLTLTGGTFNGTNTVATFNLRDEFLMVHFDSAGRGQVIANVGEVGLS